MPKIKTNRSASKRFKKTGSGKIKRNKAYHLHILEKKSPKRKRNLRRATLVSPADRKKNWETNSVLMLLTVFKGDACYAACHE